MADVEIASIEDLDDDKVADRHEAIEPRSRGDLEDGGRR